MITDDLDVWLDDSPVVNSGDYNFDVWLDDAPVVEQAEEIMPPVVTTVRRRAFIF